MVTGATGNIAIARQDFVIKQQLADLGLHWVERQEIIRLDRLRHTGCRPTDQPEESRMSQFLKSMVLPCFLAVSGAGVAVAELEEARDMMEEGRFEEARAALWPAARSGNAEAEELIGVMYALGLGVERDDIRAFDWYLRASLKGHPGAQSGIGWYYETGRGLPAPDLVRAYAWYALSAIGGDPDAAISLEDITPKLSKAELDQAQLLIDDYQVWIYPFR